MHYIQKHILDMLRTNQSLHYSQLNLDDIESGHFRYHLQQLIKAGHVLQTSRGVYRLTPAGEHYVDKLSAHRVNPHAMPKVITYTLLRDGNNVVLQSKSKRPYQHLLNMIGGKLHEGETSDQAAIREVAEKTGHTIQPARLAGIFEVIIERDGATLTHAIAYVYTANVEAAQYHSENLHIIAVDKLSTTDNLAPDFLPIFKAIDGSSTIQTGQIVVAV